MRLRITGELEYYKDIVNSLKSFCRDKEKDIKSIYYGGFSSREQCNFDGQLDMIKEVMSRTDRRRVRYKEVAINMGSVIERIIEWKKDVDEDHLGLGADLLDELIDLYLNNKKEDLL